MIRLNLSVNFDDIIDDLDDVIKKQIPYAAFLALNDTLFHTAKDVKAHVMTPRYIEGGPVPFTKRGVQYKKAPNKRKLVGFVFIPKAQWKYMMWVIDAGNKQWIRSKHGIGIPIKGNIRLNARGNIPGRYRKEGTWREIMNRGMSGRTATPMRHVLGKKEFIAESRKSGIIGLWERTGKGGRGKPKLKVMFTHGKVYYKKTVPFKKSVRHFAMKHFSERFPKRLEQVLARGAKTFR